MTMFCTCGRKARFSEGAYECPACLSLSGDGSCRCERVCMDCGGALGYDPATAGPPSPTQSRCPKCVDKILFGPRIMELARSVKAERWQCPHRRWWPSIHERRCDTVCEAQPDNEADQ